MRACSRRRRCGARSRHRAIRVVRTGAPRRRIRPTAWYSYWESMLRRSSGWRRALPGFRRRQTLLAARLAVDVAHPVAVDVAHPVAVAEPGPGLAGARLRNLLREERSSPRIARSATEPTLRASLRHRLST